MAKLPAVTVVGAGVSGLSCAVRLQCAGFAVAIVAAEPPPRTTSAIAAAIWYPYRVAPPDRARVWARDTLRAFRELAREAGSGVAMVELTELGRAPLAEPWWLEPEYRFRRLGRAELPPGYSDGLAVEVAMVESDRYLPYLLRRFEEQGGRLEVRRVARLVEVCREGSIVVDCAGLGARDLENDRELFPIRGQVVRVGVGGLGRHVADDGGAQAPVYILSRRDDCILGGTAEDGVWDTTPEAAVTARIVARCRGLEQRLAGVEPLEVLVGLRPGRSSVRLELEEELRAGAAVIHDYGHGGAGFTLSWGCADEVATLALRAAARLH